MTLPTPRAVMFDMTGTLHPQAHIATAAMAATQVVLDRYPQLVLADCLPVLHRGMLDSFAAHGANGFYLMRDVLADGHRRAWPQLGVETDDDLIGSVVRAFESTLVAVVQPYPSTLGVLAAIKRQGIATAIVSVNDEQLLQDSVDACGLRPYFDLVLSSEAARTCKPDPGMFEQAMAGLGVAAADTVFVGDMPEMDIAGANRVGMRTVLTTEDAGFIGTISDPGEDGRPDATIASLAELPALLGLTSIPPSPPPTPAPGRPVPGGTIRAAPAAVTREPPGAAVDDVPSPVPPVLAEGDVDPGLLPYATKAVADLAARLGVDPAGVSVRAAASVVWPDRSMGCGRPGMAYAQVMTDGAIIELGVDGLVYRYHSGESRSPFPCSLPLPRLPRRL